MEPPYTEFNLRIRRLPYTAILGLNTEVSVSVYGAVLLFLCSVYGAIYGVQHTIYGAIYGVALFRIRSPVYGAVYGVRSPYTETPYTAPYTAILGLNTEFSPSVYGALLLFFSPNTELLLRIRRRIRCKNTVYGVHIRRRIRR